MKTALVLGGTGLIGEYLLNLLLNDDYYQKITAITRKPIQARNKLENLVGGFDDIETLLSDKKFDHVYCCLGTTMEKAGSKEKFLQIDYAYPLKVAQLTHASGTQKFLIITAMGADASSSIFYNKVKGEVERDLTAIGFDSLHVFRPSLLLGDRDESRMGESLGQALFKVLGFLFVGPLKKFKGIDFKKVAIAMVSYGKEHSEVVNVYRSDQLQDFSYA